MASCYRLPGNPIDEFAPMCKRRSGHIGALNGLPQMRLDVDE